MNLKTRYTSLAVTLCKYGVKALCYQDAFSYDPGGKGNTGSATCGFRTDGRFGMRVVRYVQRCAGGVLLWMWRTGPMF